MGRFFRETLSQALRATGVWTFRERIAGRCAKSPGRQARSRAQGSIGVPPVFPISVQDDDQELAVRTLPQSHSPDMQPSFRDTGETPMLPLARRHAIPN